MKTIVIEPQSKTRKHLCQLLRSLEFPAISSVILIDDVYKAMELMETENYDLFFLNLDMLGGAEVMNHLRQAGKNLVLITDEKSLLTNILEESNSCSILYFPFDMEDLQKAAMNLYFAKLEPENFNGFTESDDVLKMKKISISSAKKIQYLVVEDIVYCRASSQYTEFHLECGSMVLSSKTLAHYEEELKYSGFMRIHRSYLVNLNHVSEFHRQSEQVLLSNNNSIKLSCNMKEHFLEKMKNHQ